MSPYFVLGFVNPSDLRMDATSLFDTASALLTNVIGWIGSVATELTGANGQLKDFLPFVLVPFAMMIVVFGIKSIRKLAK